MNFVDRNILETELVKVGKFRCPTTCADFEDTGPTTEYLIVFPRESVRVWQKGHEEFVANCNTAIFYNVNQEYRRFKVSNSGDRSDFFAVSNEWVVDSIRRYDPSVQDRIDRPFNFSHTMVDHEVFLHQRRLFDLVEDSCDALQIEEDVAKLVDTTIDAMFAHRGVAENRSKNSARHLELIDAVDRFICAEFRKPLSLGKLAVQFGVTASHLSRVFRRVRGCKLHSYLTQLRLRSSLEMIERHRRDLTHVALELGFNSHSHFTSAFRQTFGLTPTNWRRKPSRRFQR